MCISVFIFISKESEEFYFIRCSKVYIVCDVAINKSCKIRRENNNMDNMNRKLCNPGRYDHGIINNIYIYIYNIINVLSVT